MDLPVPRATDVSRPFWDGLRHEKLMIQYSPSSDQWVFYPRVLAPGTLADDLEWREITGAGQVYTYSIGRRPTAPPWGDRLPQIIAAVARGEPRRARGVTQHHGYHPVTAERRSPSDDAWQRGRVTCSASEHL